MLERVESPGTRFTGPFLLGDVFLRTALPCSGGYHPERGGMPLHDVVIINCKKGVTTEYRGANVKYMGSGVLDDCGAKHILSIC